MKAEDGSQLVDSLKISGGAALGLGLLYAIFMTIHDYLANAGGNFSLGITFALSWLYCAVPLFVVLFLVVGVVMALQEKKGAQK